MDSFATDSFAADSLAAGQFRREQFYLDHPPEINFFDDSDDLEQRIKKKEISWYKMEKNLVVFLT